MVACQCQRLLAPGRLLAVPGDGGDALGQGLGPPQPLHPHGCAPGGLQIEVVRTCLGPFLAEGQEAGCRRKGEVEMLVRLGLVGTYRPW